MADTKETAVGKSEPTPASDPAPPCMEAGPAATSEPPKAEAPVSKETEVVDPAASKETKVDAPAATGDRSSDGWPVLDAGHPLSKFLEQLPAILEECSYNEVYGLTLTSSGSFHTKLILQKFLRANANDLEKAKDQLIKTLKWRKEYQPTAVKDEVFSARKFGGLGYITKIEGVPGSENKVDVATFNIYGAVKDNKETFGSLDEFMRWRVAVMESSVQKLGMAEATVPIPDYGEGADPYQGFQIHDYMNVSFLRQDPLVKAASKKAIEVFGAYYPETMSRKFFVSVPLIMSWMFTAMRVFISKETQKKFTVMSYATSLAGELGDGVPEAYGGKAKSLEEIGETVKTK